MDPARGSGLSIRTASWRWHNRSSAAEHISRSNFMFLSTAGTPQTVLLQAGNLLRQDDNCR